MNWSEVFALAVVGWLILCAAYITLDIFGPVYKLTPETKEEKMKDYNTMPLEELMNEYAMLASDPIVKAYIAASDELTERSMEYPNDPESEFYRAADGYTYYIELPYDKLYVSFDKAWVKHRDYSFKYRDPDGRTLNACLSLCGYSREQIERMIDKRIEQVDEGVAD